MGILCKMNLKFGSTCFQHGFHRQKHLILSDWVSTYLRLGISRSGFLIRAQRRRKRKDDLLVTEQSIHQARRWYQRKVAASNGVYVMIIIETSRASPRPTSGTKYKITFVILCWLLSLSCLPQPRACMCYHSLCHSVAHHHQSCVR